MRIRPCDTSLPAIPHVSKMVSMMVTLLPPGRNRVSPTDTPRHNLPSVTHIHTCLCGSHHQKSSRGGISQSDGWNPQYTEMRDGGEMGVAWSDTHRSPRELSTDDASQFPIHLHRIVSQITAGAGGSFGSVALFPNCSNTSLGPPGNGDDDDATSQKETWPTSFHCSQVGITDIPANLPKTIALVVYI